MAVKTITINDVDVKFKITGFTPVRYTSMYGKDFIAEYLNLEKEINSGTIADFMPVYRIIYFLAKEANNEIAEMEEWFDSFEDGFPVFEVLPQLYQLINMNIASSLVGKSQTQKTK